MREIAIVELDDLDYAEGTRTPSETSAVIRFDGQTVELDLTREHKTELGRLLAPYLRAGHKPETTGAPHKMTRSRAFNEGMRRWADAQDPPLRYKTDTGKLYYSKKLITEYEAYLEKQAAG
jgi:hypothetical protein